MFGSQILEIAIGIIFVYLLLSLICSAVSELISRALSMRAKNLEDGIRNLLIDKEGKEYAKKFFDHPLIKGLERKGKRPSYIPSRTFSLVLMDIIAPSDSAKGSKSFEDVFRAVNDLANSKLKTVLLVLMGDTESKLKELRGNIENWFDDAMQRVSGWYKRKAQLIILLLALAVSVFFNADTLMIANSLSRDDALRDSVVAAAEEAIKQPLPAEKEEEMKKQPLSTEREEEVAKKPVPADLKLSLEKIKQFQQRLKQLELPIGWSRMPGDPREIPKDFQAWIAKILGLLFTAIAVSQGAPFWFDLLNKIVNLRSSGGIPKRTTQDKVQNEK